MEATVATLKHIRKHKDRNRFNIDNLQDYCLSIIVGQHDFQFCVTDTRKNRVLLLEDYIIQGGDTPQQQLDAISRVYEDNSLINAAFWKEVKVCVKNRQFSLVPTPLFDLQEAHNYLQLNAAYDPELDECLAYPHNQAKMTTTFAVPKPLAEFFQSKYPNGNLRIFHQSSALLEGLLKFEGTSRQKTMFIFIDRFFLHISVVKNNGLEYYNIFPIRTSEDYIKYMLGVMQTLKMDQKTSRVVLQGFIRPQSNHHKFLQKYARNTAFGRRPGNLKLSYDFDEVGEHQYFDLLNTYLCD